ncbi:dapper homolog 3-like isoform X2 [Moschus berezovskii]|uniref:dapper homolog 3-like isoform X2 n=1 Tax=Moschus berezovskii TaxID=68408 RepID=UPI002443A90B|nr:dapper homolog 3-like isoform X2 [Moschus berezovskii]
MVCPGGLDAPKWLPGDLKYGPGCREPGAAGGGRRPQALEGRGPGRAARDAFPPCVFRLKGTRTFFTTTTTKPARSRPAPRVLSPPSCHLPPPRPHPAVSCGSPARGVGRRAGCALRPTSPAATAPPRETRGRTLGAADQQEGCGRRGGRPARRPEPGGARTWRGKLHPRPGPQTSPPLLPVILADCNGLCIAL